MTPPKGIRERERETEVRSSSVPLIPFLLSRNLARLILLPRGVLAFASRAACVYCVAAVALLACMREETFRHLYTTDYRAADTARIRRRGEGIFMCNVVVLGPLSVKKWDRWTVYAITYPLAF